MRRAGWILACTTFAALTACNEGSTETGETGGGDGPMSGSTGSPVVDSSESGGTVETIDLVRADAWELAGAADDPFADQRPDFVQCEIGFDVVTGVFEVDSTLCLYGAFVQPSLGNIAAGDQIEVHIQYGELPAGEPEIARLGIAFGSEIALEREVPVPASPGEVQETWEAPMDLPAGTPVHLHLHAHETTFRFISLTATGR